MNSFLQELSKDLHFPVAPAVSKSMSLRCIWTLMLHSIKFVENRITLHFHAKCIQQI